MTDLYESFDAVTPSKTLGANLSGSFDGKRTDIEVAATRRRRLGCPFSI